MLMPGPKGEGGPCNVAQSIEAGQRHDLGIFYWPLVGGRGHSYAYDRLAIRKIHIVRSLSKVQKLLNLTALNNEPTLSM
jgi:hypothetical protein